MKNPFIFGRIVVGDSFADREDEMKILVNEIKSGQNIIITAPRRYGKTSLIVNTLKKMKKTYVYLDCSIFTSENEFASVYLSRILSKFPRKKIMNIISNYLKHLKITITLEPINISIEKRKGDEDIKEIIDLPEKVGELVVVFDEFQEIVRINDNILALLRSIIQFHKKTVYIFTGSKKHMMQRIFHNQDSPFFNFGYHMSLDKIDKKKFFDFAKNKFIISKLNIKDQIIEDILDYCDCHPYYTQLFLHFAWNLLKMGEKKDIFKKTLNSILNTYAQNYHLLFSNLTNHQKATLYALVHNERIFSAETIRKYNLKSSQHTQKSLESLLKKEIIEKNSEYYVEDVFFREWIKQNYTKRF